MNTEYKGIFYADGLSIPYTVHLSSRRTYSLAMEKEGILTIRAPFFSSKQQVENILNKKEGWILQKYLLQKERASKRISPSLSPKQADALEKRYRKAAREYIPARVSYFAAVMGVDYGRITVRGQKTRWGSCSGRGNLSFNWRLMLAPPQVIDYVVVHELCHRKEMNHSRAFWHAVEMVLPDYKIWKQWLRDNGDTLILS